MSQRTVRAHVGLGANLGAARRTLERAVGALVALPGVRLRGVSRLYRTAPWGDTDQPDFLNAAVSLDVPRGDDPAGAALAFLADLKELERRAGRRAGRRWGPRELDLDLLVFGRHQIDVERLPAAWSNDASQDPGLAARRLVVPHRDAAARSFVLAPLADLAPGLVPPGWHESVETVRRRLAATEHPDSVRIVGVWDATERRWISPTRRRAREGPSRHAPG